MILIAILILGSSLNCTKSNLSNNSNNFSSKNYLSYEEEIQINSILNKFDKLVKNKVKCESKSVENCYSKLLIKLQQAYLNDELNYGLSEQERIEILNLLSNKLFNKIFIYEEVIHNRRFKEKDPMELYPDTLQFLNLNSEGELYKFYKFEVSQENNYIKNYFIEYDRLGSISMGLSGSMIMSNKEYNLNEESMKLLLLLHILILNDNNLKSHKSNSKLANEIINY